MGFLPWVEKIVATFFGRAKAAEAHEFSEGSSTRADAGSGAATMIPQMTARSTSGPRIVKAALPSALPAPNFVRSSSTKIGQWKAARARDRIDGLDPPRTFRQPRHRAGDTKAAADIEVRRVTDDFYAGCAERLGRAAEPGYEHGGRGDRDQQQEA